MGKRGPAPQPTKLKLLHGVDKKNPQRINNDEPVPADGDVSRPEWISDRAAAVWDRLAPDLEDKGVLTAWDVDAFADLCMAIVAAQDAWTDVDQNGTNCTTPIRELSDGTIVFKLRRNPSWQVAREATALIVTLAGRFGLTPSDRSQLKIGGADEKGGAERLLS